MDNRTKGYRGLCAYDYRSPRIGVYDDSILNIDFPVDYNRGDFSIRPHLISPDTSQRPYKNILFDFDITDDLGGRVNQRRGINLRIMARQIGPYVILY